MRKVHSFTVDVRNPAPTTFVIEGKKYTLYFGKPPAGTVGGPAQAAKASVIRADEGIAIDKARSAVRKLPSPDSDASAVFELNFAAGAGMRLNLPRASSIVFILGGDWELDNPAATLKPGDMVQAPPGHTHTLRNGPNAGRALMIAAPSGVEKFFTEIAKLPAGERICHAALEKAYGICLLPRVVRTATGVEMLEIPAGDFRMGSADGDPLGKDDEKPQHRVRITKPFAIGRYPITVEQFRAFVTAAKYDTEGEKSGTGSTGLDLATGQVETRPEFSWKNPGFPQTDAHPVTCVSHADAVAFCEWLSKKEKKTFRLPTEAEWEYACRADTTTAFYNGNDVAGAKGIANVADQSLTKQWKQKLDPPAKMTVVLHNGDRIENLNPMPKGTPLPPYAEPWDDGQPFTAPVGQRTPNRFGLHDMLGQVGEWCLDWYDPGFYAKSAVEDPAGPEQKDAPKVKPPFMPAAPPLQLHVVRGGVWLDAARDCRCADRQTPLRHPVHSAADIGFRIVMEL